MPPAICAFAAIKFWFSRLWSNLLLSSFLPVSLSRAPAKLVNAPICIWFCLSANCCIPICAPLLASLMPPTSARPPACCNACVVVASCLFISPNCLSISVWSYDFFSALYHSLGVSKLGALERSLFSSLRDFFAWFIP